MDDVIAIVRAALPAIGSETTYPELYTGVERAFKNVQYLPAAIRELKESGHIRVEVGRRAGDSRPVHRIVRIGV
jgi:hypothetical protein